MTRSASDSRFAPQTLAGAVPGSRDLGRLLADLELWLLEALKRDGAPGLGAAVEVLNELGHELAPLPDEDPPRWSGPLPDGERRLVISGAASSAAEWVSATLEPIQGDDAPPEPDPRHAAFYARWETLLGLDDAAVDELEPADRMAHHLAVLEAEVNNGGFLQYLDNTEGRWLRETLGMLETLQAHRAHELPVSVFLTERSRTSPWLPSLLRLGESLFPGPSFPVPARRENPARSAELRLHSGSRTTAPDPVRENSLYLPCSTGHSAPETGSHQIPRTAM